MRLVVAVFTPWKAFERKTDLYLFCVARVHIFYYCYFFFLSYKTLISSHDGSLVQAAFSILSKVSWLCGWLLVSVSSDLLQAPFLARFNFFT